MYILFEEQWKGGFLFDGYYILQYMVNPFITKDTLDKLQLIISAKHSVSDPINEVFR